MKNLLLPFGAIVFAVALCGGALTSLSSKKVEPPTGPAPLQEEDWQHLYPCLTSDGRTLYVDGRSAINVPSKIMDSRRIRLWGVQDKREKSTLILEVKGEKVEFEAQVIKSPVWSEARQALYFVKGDHNKESEIDSIWQWTEAGGFATVSRAHGHLDRLTLSPNSKVLSAQAGDLDDYGVSNYLILSLDTRREKEVTYNDSSNNLLPLSMTEGLIDGHNELGNQTYRWRYGSERVTPLFHDANIVSVKTVGSTVFGIHKREKKFEIVQLNEAMNGWTASFSLPTGVDTRNRPER